MQLRASVLLFAVLLGCGGDDAGTLPDAGCPAGQQLCGSTCVNVQSDNMNCGSCGNACAAGQVCNGAGTCELTCQAGLLACGGTCVDPDTDRMHCGATGDCEGANAGTTCTAGQICNGSGMCELSCQPGLLACNGTCIDPDTDRAYCGATANCQGANAGTACAAGEVCNGSGVCELSCQSGLLDCNGTCIDPDTDRAYCGATTDCQGANAGTACDAGEICNGAGACALSCQTGLLACGGTCTNPATDVTYCGASGDCTGANAGTTCGPNEGCSNGVCRPYKSGFANVTFPIAVPTSTFGLGQLEIGFGGDLFVAGAGTKDIFRISEATGAATTFATDVITSSYQLSLVFDPGTNALYAGSDGGALVKVSSAGVATSFATVSGQLNSMTLAPAGFGTYGGQILVGTTTGLYAVDQNAATPTVTTISTAVGQISDLVFNGTTLYIVSNGTDVRTITAAGTTATVGTVAGATLDGIVYDAKRSLLYLADSNADVLWSMTLAGTSTNLGAYDFDSGFFISGLLLVNPDLLLLGTGESNLTIRSRVLP